MSLTYVYIYLCVVSTSRINLDETFFSRARHASKINLSTRLSTHRMNEDASELTSTLITNNNISVLSRFLRNRYASKFWPTTFTNDNLTLLSTLGLDSYQAVIGAIRIDFYLSVDRTIRIDRDVSARIINKYTSVKTTIESDIYSTVESAVLSDRNVLRWVTDVYILWSIIYSYLLTNVSDVDVFTTIPDVDELTIIADLYVLTVISHKNIISVNRDVLGVLIDRNPISFDMNAA